MATKDDDAPEGYVKESDLDAIIAKKMVDREQAHEKELTAARARAPQLVVPAHAGGPGNDNHRESWSLAEQEAAARGDDLEHWHDDE